mgnify:CR=1|jgi:hypothetical protein
MSKIYFAIVFLGLFKLLKTRLNTGLTSFLAEFLGNVYSSCLPLVNPVSKRLFELVFAYICQDEKK